MIGFFLFCLFVLLVVVMWCFGWRLSKWTTRIVFEALNHFDKAPRNAFFEFIITLSFFIFSFFSCGLFILFEMCLVVYARYNKEIANALQMDKVVEAETV